MSDYYNSYNEFGDPHHDSYNPRLNKGIYVPEPDPIIWNETLLTLGGYRFSYSRVTFVTEEDGRSFVEPAFHYSDPVKWGLYINLDADPATTRWLHDFDTSEDLMAFMALPEVAQPVVSEKGLLMSLEYAWRVSLIMQLSPNEQLPVIDDVASSEFTTWFIENCMGHNFELFPGWADAVIHHWPSHYASTNPCQEGGST